MAAILPLLTFGLLFRLLINERSGPREAFIKTSVIWCLVVIIITEVLRPLDLIVPPILACLWLLIIGFIFFLLVKRYRWNLVFEKPQLHFFVSKLTFSQWALIGIVAAIVAFTGFLALVVAPNNFDSMTYHMSRVAHWVQDKTVSFYPTAILRQLYQSPGAEYIILQFQVLSGNDYFANLVQWFSMAGSLVGVSLISKTLGATLWGQIIAVVFCATLPMGILQSTTTQNDYVVGFWLVCFVYFLLRWLYPGCGEEKDKTTTPIIFFSSSLGLALLTKATAYIVAFPFVMLLVIFSIRLIFVGGGGKKIKPFYLFALFGFIVISINASQYLRNYELFGSPLGPSGESPTDASYSYLNREITPQTLISNLARNASLHLATSNEALDAGLFSSISYIHKVIGTDLNNPKTTWGNLPFAINSRILPDEDLTGNFFHFILIFISACAFLISKKMRQNRVALGYFICLVCGILLFCLLLVYQPWNSRLHLPFFVLFSPFVGLVLQISNYRKLVAIILFFIFITALPNLLLNKSKPVFGEMNVFVMSRVDEYFLNTSEYKAGYKMASDLINSQNCSKIGLIIGGDQPEYPLWKLLQKNANNNDVQIEHVKVQNISESLPESGNEVDGGSGTNLPCAIISTLPQTENVISLNGQNYWLKMLTGKVSVFFQE